MEGCTAVVSKDLFYQCGLCVGGRAYACVAVVGSQFAGARPTFVQPASFIRAATHPKEEEKKEKKEKEKEKEKKQPALRAMTFRA